MQNKFDKMIKSNFFWILFNVVQSYDFKGDYYWFFKKNNEIQMQA